MVVILEIEKHSPFIYFLSMKVIPIYGIQSNLYLEVFFGTQKKWSYKTGDVLILVQFI
jgi:hypothetical protein